MEPSREEIAVGAGRIKEETTAGPTVDTINNYIHCVNQSMAAKTIAVDSEAYALLAKSKRPGETFSDVVKRSIRPRRALTDFAGAWKDMDPKEWARIEGAIFEGRRLDSTRHQRLASHWK